MSLEHPPAQSAPAPAVFPYYKGTVGLRDALLRSLGGFKFTLTLFGLLGLLAAIGTFFPQGQEAPRIADMYGQGVYDAAVKFGVADIYRSAWFIVVLGLMAMNLILVTWVRVPHVWRISRETDAVSLKDPLVPKTAFTRVWETPLEPMEALDRARTVMLRDFPRLAHKSGPRKRMVVGERHFLSLWAAHIVHLGLLLLLAAGLVKILWGSNKQVVIREGETMSVPIDRLRWNFGFDSVQAGPLKLYLPRFFDRVEEKAPFQLALDHFEVRYYASTGAPSLFRSDVKVLKDGQVEKVASIKVNDPLEQDGMMLYQASWGYEGLYSANFNLTLPGFKDALDVRAPYRQKIKLLDTGWDCEVTDFYPDAGMAGPGKLVNVGDQLQNPAIRVQLWQHGVERTHTWYVYSMPDIQMSKFPGIKVEGKTVDPIAFTVLEANADPGLWFAIVGSFLVVFGVFSAFYLFHRKAWVLVEPLAHGGSRVTLAGFVRRNKVSFKRVFDRLSTGVDHALAKGLEAKGA